LQVHEHVVSKVSRQKSNAFILLGKKFEKASRYKLFSLGKNIVNKSKKKKKTPKVMTFQLSAEGQKK